MNIKVFNNVPDLITRNIKYNFRTITIYYLETLTSLDKINDYVLNNLTKFSFFKPLTKTVSGPNFKKITINEIEKYLYNGYTIIIDRNNIYSVETKADLDRSISVPEIEQSLFGPKDSFVENYQKNIGLIKKRIKSTDLKTYELFLGKYSNSKTGVLYIDSITKKEVVDNCISKLKDINIDKVIDVGELKNLLVDESKTFFPTIEISERPDKVVSALLNGKIIILMDNSPFALILPAFLADFINPISDNYIKSKNVNYLKILRLICFLLTIILPSYYVAIVDYNQETIPASLLNSFIIQRQGIPFPSTVEMFIMLITCDILKESDLRFPSSYGSSISILGALIIGDAAVNANLVSPIVIIVASLTFISSMMFNNQELNNAIRMWRFLFLIMASFLGLYGISLSLLLFITNLCSINSFGFSYTFPIAPFDLSYIKSTLLKFKVNKYRSKELTNNIKRSK